MKKILLYTPRQWNLQWGQEKDLINSLNKDYEITVLEFFDYLNLKGVYDNPKNTNVIIRKTKLKPGVIFGINSEIRNFRDSIRYKHDILITYLTAGTVLATIFSRLRGKKVVLIYADDMPELHKNSSYLTYIVTKYIFNPLSALFANKIIVTARLLAEDITYFGKKPIYLSNGVNLVDYSKPVKPIRITKKPGSFVLGFIGGFGEWVDFDMVLDFAKANPDVNVLLVGDGEQFSIVKKKSEGLKNITMTGMVPRAKAMQYLAGMDACLIPFKIIRLTDRVSPIKLFEYWAMKKPVISSNFYEVKETGKGIVLVANNPDEIRDAVNKLRKSKRLKDNIIKKGFETVKNYDWNIIGKKYLKIIKDL